MSEFALDNMIVGDIMAKWPETAKAFNRHKMACPGCVMAPFMTLAEVCEAYGLNLDDFVETLRRSINQESSDQQESIS